LGTFGFFLSKERKKEHSPLRTHAEVKTTDETTSNSLWYFAEKRKREKSAFALTGLEVSILPLFNFSTFSEKTNVSLVFH
tara:strand:+ start:116 stop:355 length:240 start_codon:yes stop_codon:yes gene_type:complete